MKIAIFASNKTSKEGRKFTVYTARITSKSTGEQIGVRVKFAETAGEPKAIDCPMWIDIDKGSANLAERKYLDEASQTERKSYTLWVKSWTPNDEPYVDHSLDDFE